MNRFGILLRQRIRRDRVQVPLWVFATALMAYAGYSGVTQSYATLADRQNILAAALANPVILMFRGLPSGTSEGAFLAFEILPWLAMLAGFMSTFLAVRHTRGDEEAGRAGLIWATPAGRRMPAASTLAHGLIANLALGAVTGLALLSTGLPAAGSWLTAGAAASCGVAFLGFALLAAQVMRTSRGANALAVWVLVATFLIRGIGNAAGTAADDLSGLTSVWPAWLSPFGWAEQTRPYDEDLVWPVLLGLGCGLVLAGCAAALQSMRDLDAGLVAERPGRADARAALGSSHALVRRLTAGSILGWVIGGAITGILATTLSGLVDQVSGENPAVAAILEKIGGSTGGLDEVVVTVFFTMLGILAACCAVQTVIRARQEEAHGTAEPVLATPVRRVVWLADYMITATAAVALVTAAGVLAGWAGVLSRGSDAELIRIVAIAGIGQAVAASVFTALTALVFALLPRATMIGAWMLVLVAAMLGLFGPLFGMPEWTTRLSPFAVTPLADGAGVDARGLWWLVAVAAAATAASLVLMRRRELASD